MSRRWLYSSKLVTAGYFVAVFAFAFFVAFLSVSHFMPVSESSAEENGTYYTNISSMGDVSFDFVSTPVGTAKIGRDALTISTNATSGYKLYISTVGGATSNGLCLENDTTKCIVASEGTPENPQKLAVNTWGYVPGRSLNTETAETHTDADVDAKTGSAIIRGVPTYGHEDMLYTNLAPSTSGSNSVDVYYGVNISTALPSGDYSNTVVYTAITDATNPSSSPVTISPVSQSGLGAGTDLTITTNLYPGLPIGSIGDISVKIGDDYCTNVTPSLGANGELMIGCKSPAKSSPGAYAVSIYVAKYNKAYELADAYEYTAMAMQEFVPDPAAAVGTTVELIDVRNNEMYTVAKLADRNWWMVEDLKLGGDEDMTLTSDNTDVTSDFVLKAENTGKWNAGSAADFDQSLMMKTGALYGYYYNWYAATAGTGTYEMKTDGQNATSSICPKNWTLPTGGNGGQLSALSVAYGGPVDNQGSQQAAVANLMNTPAPAFDYSGYHSLGGGAGGTNNGWYWSKTATGSRSSAYNLLFNNSGLLYPRDDRNKNYGFAIRCIYQESMQTFSPDPAAAVGTTKELPDTRDGKKYKVSKLADNNWWMVEDLKLGGDSSMTLTSADSNVDTSFTLPAEDTSGWCGDWNSECIDSPKMLKTGVTNGYLYNWNAATAGAGVYDVDSGNVTASICPKGWTLPIGGNGQFSAFSVAYNGPADNEGGGQQTAVTNLMTAPSPAFNWTGYRSGNSINYPDDGAFYWSRTAYSTINAFNLDFNNYGGISPRANYNKYDGLAIRCVKL